MILTLVGVIKGGWYIEVFAIGLLFSISFLLLNLFTASVSVSGHTVAVMS